MTIKSFRFEVAEARSFKHPHFSTIQKHIFLVPAGNLPQGIPDGANLREATGMNRAVYKDVRASLRGLEAIPGSFDLLNLGITIIAESISAVDKRTFDVLIDDEYGIVNGGHTTKLIWECQDDGTIAEGQHVEVKIITGVEGANDHTLRVDIARGQNTGIAVKPQSIFELDGAFEGIKDSIATTSWSDCVAYRESDNKSIDVRELISAMELMNIDDYPVRESKHPVAAYEKWSTPLKKFGDDFKQHRDSIDTRKYAKYEHLLPEILTLYDIVRRDFLRMYEAEVSKHGAKLKIVEHASKRIGKFQFPYAGLDPTDKRLTKGAAYPILGAFRNYIEHDLIDGKAQWIGGFENVKNVWTAIGPELVKETKQAISEIGNTPDVLGKNRNHWSNLFKTVKLYRMEEKLSHMEEGVNNV